ncbi:bifunctional diaminohydroxyphosphoribosylaminopyrimidine deaminase/5-amino-6-(5-phosphoribosylamino)uracil reductase [Halobacillus halophilus]|uniref:Riboflavin biosynthesis protein RibD n=1 Tax=Halobacillus halophilus (strain ATCC 35676 / DSM 2266 / JCM 20832 / KCTC 3685 / LMG 17431 / NBRC 102448 / NCIMB 2269) TaxID=866895 RepID=I0JS98_HALH3|nr:bifunctional diaminohydroxyphosphoribosylaminopyrimidine deaminase/5-amino-6-(5-phosphoribosylamino)uracil reductase RibD [Halobacillus halophilus]ASF40958.1 bifunctional diaminohydroxyphosphoribosylaminopyrimidine deaminase/5-amino-6-(5-phosphoribosylamino)uracil reductase [Halobacillus halophilus]CCG47019.1 riboflavin biosynthesis protein RibD [Halobacillus halophilus DSM 2266]
MSRDEQYMKTAIQMAGETVGQTSPNPSVGAIVIKDNELVGLGVHVKAGEAHAEVHALQMAGEKAKGAEIYVTLEPCSHYGKTPPCAKAIIDAGIKRVVIASHDPNPEVSGKGINMMREAGIEVETNVLTEEADRLNKDFFHFIQTGEPYVRLKAAMSLDGKIATSTGESQWITGKEAREDGHTYRHISDAILVGIQTVLSDDPTLTTRIEGKGNNPIRVVFDSNLRIPLSSKLIQNQEAPTWIFTGKHASKNMVQKLQDVDHIRVIQQDVDQIDIHQALQYLGEQKVTSLLVEGGGTIADAFVRAGKVEETITYIAPKLIGGKDASSPVAGKGISELKNVPDYQVVSNEQIGEDIKIVSVRRREINVYRDY